MNIVQAFKLPGPDDLLHALIQQSMDIIMSWMVVLFKASLKVGCIPRLWMETIKSTFYSKGGKAMS